MIDRSIQIWTAEQKAVFSGVGILQKQIDQHAFLWCLYF